MLSPRPISGRHGWSRIHRAKTEQTVGNAMNALASAATKDRYKCVVIDDDPDICALISRVLSKIGVTSLGLASAEALERALKEPHPEVIFLDVALDRSDAIDGIRILRQGSFAGAVQLISGKDPELLNDIKAIGERHGLKMLDPLRKPFRSENLRQIFAGGRSDVVSQRCRRRETEQPSPAGIRMRSRASISARRSISIGSTWPISRRSTSFRDRVVGAEGLARLNHPVHGVLSPQSFLPGATESALNRLTEFVVKKAFLDWEVLASAGRNLRLAVNAPVKALIDPHLAILVRDNHPRNSEMAGPHHRGHRRRGGAGIRRGQRGGGAASDLQCHAGDRRFWLRLFVVRAAEAVSVLRTQARPELRAELRDRLHERRHLSEHRRSRARDRRNLRRGGDRDRD